MIGQSKFHKKILIGIVSAVVLIAVAIPLVSHWYAEYCSPWISYIYDPDAVYHGEIAAEFQVTIPENATIAYISWGNSKDSISSLKLKNVQDIESFLQNDLGFQTEEALLPLREAYTLTGFADTYANYHAKMTLFGSEAVGYTVCISKRGVTSPILQELLLDNPDKTHL